MAREGLAKKVAGARGHGGFGQVQGAEGRLSCGWQGGQVCEQYLESGRAVQ